MKLRSCIIWLSIVAVLSVGAVAVMLYIALTADHARLEYSFSDPLEKMTLQGRFRIGNGLWQTYPPEDMDTLRSIGDQTVEFDGAFQQNIPQGRKVFVYVRHVQAVMTINGKTLFAIDGESSPAFTRTPGNFWASFTSPGITTEDAISISLQRIPGNSHTYQIDLFLENMQTGSVWELLKKELYQVWWAVPLSCLFMTVSFLLMILAILFTGRKETNFALQAIFLAGVYISIGVWAMSGYELMSLFIPFPTALIVWETFSLLSSAVFIILYLSTLLTGKRQIAALYMATTFLLFMIAAVILQLTGSAELFVIQTHLQALGLCLVLICLALSFIEGKIANKEAMRAFMTFIPLCLVGSIDIPASSLGPATKGIFACFGFLITAILQLFLLMSTAYNKMERANRLERELMESRVAISLSQIRPHFLYNILTSIHYLCTEDPPRAERAITNFTMFLRGNLDSLSSAAPISLAQEMEHVRQYLSLEQLRYGDKLRVEWDLREIDFSVPALSVQPLAENAVHWGMRPEGLTVRIVAHSTDKGHVVIVEDDGQGFDPKTARPPRGKGVGLASTRTRVRDIYNGSLTLDSTPGKGTVATLFFPSTTSRRHQ